MGAAFKTLKVSDVSVFPYVTNKFWQANTSSYNSLGIRIFVGQNITGSFLKASDPLTTDSASGDTLFKRLVYNTTKQLYYSNYLSASYRTYSSSADNFEQTTIYSQIDFPSYQNYFNGPLKYFPTASNSIIRVMSIPKNIYGSKITPKTFFITSSGYNIFDDGEGNLLDQNNQLLVGNIIYPHGLIVITNPSYSLIFPTSSNDSFVPSINQITGSFNLSFKGDYIIFENEVRCSIEEDEFNYTLNPSISSDNSGSLRDFATGSNFNPYVTTVGLYNDNNELMIVGKLAKSVNIPRNNSISFILRYDS